MRLARSLRQKNRNDMKIYPNKLTAQLSATILPIYLLSGDELLLLNEAHQQILHAAKQQGFTDREIHTDPSNADWNNIQANYQSLSLFGDKSIIDIKLSSAKFSDTIKSALATFIQIPNPDKLILISCPKIESATTKAKWFKAVEDAIGFLQFWPVTREQFPGWLKQRLQSVGVNLTPSALQLLAEHTEGNLLAAQQVINRLQLQYGQTQKLNDTQLMQILSDFSQTDLYQLLDEILNANGKRIIHALHNLQGQGTESILVLWLLSKEIRAYLALISAYQQKQELSNIFRQFQIWPNRQNAYRPIFQKHQLNELINMQAFAYHIDAGIKGLHKINVWDALTRLCLAMACLQNLPEVVQ